MLVFELLGYCLLGYGLYCYSLLIWLIGNGLLGYGLHGYGLLLCLTGYGLLQKYIFLVTAALDKCFNFFYIKVSVFSYFSTTYVFREKKTTTTDILSYLKL